MLTKQTLEEIKKEKSEAFSNKPLTAHSVQSDYEKGFDDAVKLLFPVQHKFTLNFNSLFLIKEVLLSKHTDPEKINYIHDILDQTIDAVESL